MTRKGRRDSGFARPEGEFRVVQVVESWRRVPGPASPVLHTTRRRPSLSARGSALDVDLERIRPDLEAEMIN